MPSSKDMNHFTVNPVGINMSRSIQNLNHSVKFSGNLGPVYPFLCQEVLPGDTWSVDTAKVIRLQPLVTPIMDNIILDTSYFFIPNRLVWSHWINFMGENTASKWTPSVTYNVPKIKIPSGGFDVGSLADYLGVPPKTGAGEEINALPFRAYALVMDQWYRAESLQDPVHVTIGDTTVTGVNTTDQVTDVEKGGTCFVAGKIPDYFTSCLPAPQSGPAVTFSLAGQAPVYTGQTNWLNVGDDSTPPLHLLDVTGSSVVNPTGGDIRIANNGNIFQSNTTGGTEVHYLSPSNLYADMGRITQFSINELRTAFAVQRYYEKLALGGRRYIETLWSLFGVRSEDARLQRPEFLGGNRININVSTNEQTSATESSLTPQGNVTGVSHTGDVNSDFTKSFTEHGYIIGVCTLRIAKHCYQQGLPRHFRRNTVFDYYNPVFANLGEQAVMESEIYFDSATMNTVFGYQEAWAEYRHIPSSVHSEMRSVATTSLDSWHLADYYTSAPSLSSSWIMEDKTNLDRALAVTSSVSNQAIFDFYIQAKVARPMPLYSIPASLSRI